jgi:hypothetical protein
LKKKNDLKKYHIKQYSSIVAFLKMCCPICLEEFTKEDNQVVTSCKHTFHKQCLEKCMKVSLPQCPLCRQDIVKDLEKWNFKLKQVELKVEEQEIVYYSSDDEESLRPFSPPRYRSLLHRMIYGNKPIH